MKAAVIVRVESLGSETICLSGITLQKWAFAREHTDRSASAMTVLFMKTSVIKITVSVTFLFYASKKSSVSLFKLGTYFDE